MQRTLLLAKIHSCTLTAANLNYVGSISIDQTLLEAAGILPRAGASSQCYQWGAVDYYVIAATANSEQSS